LGACSASISSQSKPVAATISETWASARLNHRPICGSRRASAALKAFFCCFIGFSGC